MPLYLEMNNLIKRVQHKACKVYLIGDSNTQYGFADAGFASQPTSTSENVMLLIADMMVTLRNI